MKTDVFTVVAGFKLVQVVLKASESLVPLPEIFFFIVLCQN